jgi:hypothetical protein
LRTALPTNTSHRKQETFLYEYPLHGVLLATKNAQQKAALWYVRHFDYWNLPLNVSMRVSYLDCHEARLCCYLVTHIENLLRSLLLFYFHLWPIYWFSLADDGIWGYGVQSSKESKLHPETSLF